MDSNNIYTAVDLANFQFTPRCSPFNWRLLHGVDVDTLVRLNDIQRLEAVVPALQQGSIDAEGASLSSHNYVQLFRLVQLAVEHLWQMRESHAKLYPAYAAAVAAAESWRAAAEAYLGIGGQLLNQLQCDDGAVLSEQLLAQVAAAREDLEQADAAYNTALDKLEAEDAAARCHSLRRQQLEISWRLVFGLDVQHMLITGSVSQLEQLLPQVAYGNIMAENPAALTAAHFRQLLLLGQACLDYLHAICCATSKVLEQQVQQLAAGSGPIPQLTTACEELRAGLTAGLSSSIKVMQAGSSTSTTSASASAPTHYKPVPLTPTVTPIKPSSAAASTSCAAATHSSPSCHHIAHMQMTGHHQAGNSCGSGCAGSCSCCCCDASMRPQSPHRCCHHHHGDTDGSRAAGGSGRGGGGGNSSGCFCSHCCCNHCGGVSSLRHGGGAAAACAGGCPECSALLSGRLFDVGLTPAASKLQLRVEQLDRDLRHERECTLGMRQALEEITAMLQELPSPGRQQQQQQHKQKQRQPSPPKQPPQQQPQQQPHTVNVPVTISMSGEGARGKQQQESPPVSPGGPTARDANGAVRVLINEDAIRARERSAAGQQLSDHISDIIMAGHHLNSHRRSCSPYSTAGGSSPTQAMSNGRGHLVLNSSSIASGSRPFESVRPLVTVRSVPSSSDIQGGLGVGAAGGRPSQAAAGVFDPRASGEFMSGPVRGFWGRPQAHSTTAHSSGGGNSGREGYVGNYSGLVPAAGADHWQARDGAQQQQQLQPDALGQVGLGDFMTHALQQAQQQQHQQQVPAASSPEAAAASDGALQPHSIVLAAQPHHLADMGGFLGPAAAPAAPAAAAPSNPGKKQQQELFKEAAGKGFARLLRSVSPKRMFGSRPGSASGKANGTAAAAAATAAAAPLAGSLQWPSPGALAPGSAASSPDGCSSSYSPTRSGTSFTAAAAARAAEELLGLQAKAAAAPAGVFSPLKASLVVAAAAGPHSG